MKKIITVWSVTWNEDLIILFFYKFLSKVISKATFFFFTWYQWYSQMAIDNALEKVEND